MKALWTILSTLAVANILALGAFFAWLHSTERLNTERIHHIRAVFAQPIPAEAAAKAEQDAKAEAEIKARAEAQRMAVPPQTALARIAMQEQEEEVRLQHILRQQRELEDLRRSLDRDRARLQDEENRLLRDREAFEAYRRSIADIEGAQQFRKALSTLESQKAKDAKLVLDALLAERQVEQVVTYLSAMDERVRGRIMAEFVKDSPIVAADLLERLRTRGVEPTGPEAGSR